MTETLQCHFCGRQEARGVRVWGVCMCGPCQDDLLEAPVGGDRYMHFLRLLKEAKESWDQALEGKA